MLIAGINKTIFATADDELRPVMNGVYFNFEQGKLTFVATDAHKLVRSMVECPDVDFNASFILPKKPANLLKGVLLKEEEPIRVMFDAKNVTFELKNHKLVCRLIEGNYPHHAAIAFAHVGNALHQVFRYLGVTEIGYNRPAGERYPTEIKFF
jgi:DNA polymerase-3 subunit beta